MEPLTDDRAFSPDDIHADALFLQFDHNDQLNQMQQLLSNGKAALAADQFEHAQQNFTQLYTDIHSKLLPVCLALRAYTCQRQKAYMEGVALADQYIDKKRDDADAYLLAGNMRLLSSDSDSALQVYRAGVQHSSGNHPRYPALVKQRDYVEQQIHRNNTRLMRAFPHEVIHRTLSYLERSELSALASTCRAWHKFVLAWPGMWHEITISNMDDLLPGHPGQQFLARAPPQHIRKLSFHTDSNDILCSKTYKQITRFNWNHLEELDIYCDGATDAHNYMERSDTAVSVIRNCKDTLKRLRLKCDHGRVLSYSMESCPNLECLIFENYRHSSEEHPVIMEAASILQPPGPFRLSQLFIRCDKASLAIIGLLVSKCPHLETLRVIHNGSGLNDTLRTIRSHCPRLQTLEIESGIFAMLERSRFAPLPQRADNSIQGLRQLAFSEDPKYFKEGLTALIHNSCHSLEILDVSSSFSVTDVYELFAGTQMHNLRVIKCGHAVAENPSIHLKAMIDASPRLQEVQMTACRVFDVDLAALGRRSNLTELRFHVDEHVTNTGLDALFCYTPSLQQTSVTYSGMRDRVSMCQLLRTIAGCKPLLQLELHITSWMDDISDTEAHDLMEHIELQQPTLQKVIMSTFQSNIPGALILLWSKFKKLRYLSINMCPVSPPVSWTECASLIAQIGIPGLKVEFSHCAVTRIFQLDSNGNYHSDADDNDVIAA